MLVFKKYFSQIRSRDPECSVLFTTIMIIADGLVSVLQITIHISDLLSASNRPGETVHQSKCGTLALSPSTSSSGIVTV